MKDNSHEQHSRESDASMAGMDSMSDEEVGELSADENVAELSADENNMAASPIEQKWQLPKFSLPFDKTTKVS